MSSLVRQQQHLHMCCVLQLAENQQRQQGINASRRSGAAAAAATSEYLILDRSNKDLKAMLAIDGEEQRRLDSDSAKYLQIALTNYRRYVCGEMTLNCPLHAMTVSIKAA